MLAYNQKSFLIVDDFSDFRSSVRSMLRELGVKEVDTADTGEQALRMCSQKRYDFVLHDFNLGDGRKNGQQVLEDLMIERLLSYESVFIMVTAENSQAMVMSALEWEPDGYLTKPFNRAGLAQRLEKLVQRKTLLKPILQALDRRKPAEVLAACDKLIEQDPRYAPLCLRYKADALRDLKQNEPLEAFLKTILADRPRRGLTVHWAACCSSAARPPRHRLSTNRRSRRFRPCLRCSMAWLMCWWRLAMANARSLCWKAQCACRRWRCVDRSCWASWRWATRTSKVPPRPIVRPSPKVSIRVSRIRKPIWGWLTR